MQKARALDSTHHEAALVLGMYRYLVSTLSLPLRLVAGLSGLSGDRTGGLALLIEASSPGAGTEFDATILLLIACARERRYADALTNVDILRAAFPHNRLFDLNAAASAIEAHEFGSAEQRLTNAMIAHDLHAAPSVLGESALWFLKRGTARSAMGQTAEARRDLTRALAEGPRDWVRARIHRQLGHLAVAASASGEARDEFRRAMEYGRRGGDVVTVDQARRALTQIGEPR
jgi:hypothetical protein